MTNFQKKLEFIVVLVVLGVVFLQCGCVTNDTTATIREDLSRIDSPKNRPIMAVLEQYDIYGLYIGHDIPAGKAVRARRYCRVPEDDQILGYLRTSLFWKNGAIITEKGIYINNPWYGNAPPGRFYMPYDVFINQKITYDDSLFVIQIGSLSICHFGGLRGHVSEMLTKLQKSLLAAKADSVSGRDSVIHNANLWAPQGGMEMGRSTDHGSALNGRSSTSVVLPQPTWNKVNVAVADLNTFALHTDEVKTLTEVLRSALVSTDYFAVLSRSDMKDVLEAQAFQTDSACDDTACLVEMGQILSVQKIVGSTLGRVGSTYSLSLRFVDVETGNTELSVIDQWRGEVDGLLTLVQDTVKALAGEYARKRQEM